MPAVLIVDDNLLVRQGLKQLIHHEYRQVTFGEARTPAEALAHIARRSWDVIILDAGLLGKERSHGLADIRRRCPSSPILALSPRASVQQAAQVRKLGVTGYAGKDASRDDLLRAIRNVIENRPHFDGLSPASAPPRATPDLSILSPREHEVMLALVEGQRAVDIASDMKLSIKTVSTYKRRLFDKLQVRSVPDLVRLLSEGKIS